MNTCIIRDYHKIRRYATNQLGEVGELHDQLKLCENYVLSNDMKLKAMKLIQENNLNISITKFYKRKYLLWE